MTRLLLPAIGTAFVKHYYEQFDNNRAALSTLYTEQSKLTFEGEQFMGSIAIMQKLTVCVATLPLRNSAAVQLCLPLRNSADT